MALLDSIVDAQLTVVDEEHRVVFSVVRRIGRQHLRRGRARGRLLQHLDGA